MSFFDRWFNGKDATSPQPNISFGRYSDSYKSIDNYDAWDLALKAFADEQYLDAYHHFFRFLRDEAEDNVIVQPTKLGYSFELFQGSKRISGFATNQLLRAEAKIAKLVEPRPALLKRLVNQNYSLRYSRYAIDPAQHITITFDSKTLDASPYKLYYALKELATQADKQDDLLLEEFQQLTPVETNHLIPLSETERNTKCHFIANSIRKVIQEVDYGALDKKKYPGGVAYLLLDLIYSLDYLIKPEGHTMEALERAHRHYFAKEDKQDTFQKNEALIQELRALLARTNDDYLREMYRVKTTFGITLPVTHDRVASLIDAELPHLDWYSDNGYEQIALAVPGYIVGYCLFNYAVPEPDRDFFHLYYRIMQPKFFRELGFQADFCDETTQRLHKKAIR